MFPDCCCVRFHSLCVFVVVICAKTFNTMTCNYRVYKNTPKSVRIFGVAGGHTIELRKTNMPDTGKQLCSRSCF